MNPLSSDRLVSQAKHSLGVVLLTGLSLTLVAAGCSSPKDKRPEPKPAEVTVQKATEEEITDFEDFTGRLEAFKKVDIQARVTGFLEKVNFEEGGMVTEKDVLFEIDPRPYKADLDKADATVIQSQARLKRLEGDLRRAGSLLASRAISKEEHEKVLGDHAEAEAALGVAKASRETAALFHTYTKVKSPISGRVGRSLIDPGNLVKADMTMLTTIVSESPIYAYFDVDERTHIRLRRMLTEKKIPSSGKTKVPVKLALADEKDFLHAGYIDFEDTIIDPATGTRRMRGVFENQKGLFTPGMFIRVRLQVGRPYKATVVAEQGVGTDQSQKYVYVVDAAKGNKAEYRTVTTGPLWKVQRVTEDGKKFEVSRRVILDGLKPGEQVIISGLQKVRTGATVTPIEEKSSAKTVAKTLEAPPATVK